jgi:hypothetical protein
MIRTQVSVLFLVCTFAFAQDDHTGVNHTAVDSRGDHVMGFSHEKTTHHFRLYRDGGAIEVTANDPKDTESRDQIQMHLAHIAKMFAAGDFNAPMLVHDKVPPGTPAMQKMKSEIKYAYEKTQLGARVLLATKNPEALAAVHEFLRFQINDHLTRDSLALTPLKQE